MNRTSYSSHDVRAERPNPVSLLGAIALLALGPAGLYKAAGPPHLPATLPTWQTIAGTLQGSDVPWDVVGYTLVTAAWGLWLWAVVSFAVHLFLAVAEVLTHGAAWVAALRPVANRLTLPVVRRLVDGALVATVVVNTAGRATPAFAEAVPVGQTTLLAAAASGSVVALEETDGTRERPLADHAPATTAQPEPESITYVVQPGDTLWTIAERFYGSGYDYGRIADANAGQRMADESTFEQAGVIRPGWQLRIPPLSIAVQHAGDQLVYVVQEGDTLQGIAARLLGDEAAWHELFEANRGDAHLSDGRTLTHPDLIWPGLQLRLPLAPAAPMPAPGDVLTEAAAAHTVLASEAALPVRQESRVSQVDPAEATAEPAPTEDSATAPIPSTPVLPAGSNIAYRPEKDPETALIPPAEVALQSSDLPEDSLQPLTIREQAPEQAPNLVPSPNAAEAEAVRTVVGGLGAVAVGIGGATLLAQGYRRRRYRRSLDEPPAMASVEGLAEGGGGVLSGDFADAELKRVVAHRLQGEEMEPAALGARSVLRFLKEHGVGQVLVLTALQRRESGGLTLGYTLQMSLVDAARTMELAPLLGARLGGSARATLTPEQDVELWLSELRSLRLLLAGDASTVATVAGEQAAGEAIDPAMPLLLPMGTRAGGQVLYANWYALGNVLVAGANGESVASILTSLVATLAARRRPQALRLWTVGPRRVLPDTLLALPHQQEARLHPTDESQLSALAGTLRAELVRRMRRARTRAEWSAEGNAADSAASERALFETTGEQIVQAHREEEPDLVVILGELTDLYEASAPTAAATLLEILGADAPAYGIHVIAGTAFPERLEDSVLAHFATRAVLRLPAEETSIRLLHSPAATDLGHGGHYLLRLNGRAAVPARGFRIAPEELETLARLLSTSEERVTTDLICNDVPAMDVPATTPPVAIPAPRQPDTCVPVTLSTADASAEVVAYSAQSEPTTEPADAPSGPPLTLTPSSSDTHVDALSIAPAATSNTANGHAPTDGDRETHVAISAGTERVTSNESSLQVYRGQEDISGIAAADALVPTIPQHQPAAAAAKAGTRVGGEEPLFRLRCFGTALQVESNGRLLVPKARGITRLKEWEILSFLAIQPDGVVRKEKLQCAMWPDSDPEEASVRLRKCLSRLREVLAEQVPSSPSDLLQLDRSRDGFCTLKPEIAVSDAQEFQRLCQVAATLPPSEAIQALERARALYQGDLLVGASYEWLDDRNEDGVTLREHFRHAYHKATNALGDLYGATGQVDRAIALYRELLVAEPLLEDVVRRLYRCYAKQQDRSALVREHRQLRQALRQAYAEPGSADEDSSEYHPSAETTRLYEQLLAELDAKGAASPATSEEQTRQTVLGRAA